MSSPSPQQEVGGLSITDVDHMVVTHVGGWDYHVLNTAHDYPRVYQVDVKALTCTCEDHMYRRDGNPEVCKHVAKALLVAPAEISMDRHAATTVLEVLQKDAQATQTDATDEAVAEAVESAEADEEADTDASDGSEGNAEAVDRDGQRRVRDWLEDEDVDVEHVTVYSGGHDGTAGIRVEPDKQGMGDKEYEWFKSVLREGPDNTVHLGHLDDGCPNCESDADGFFWHLPSSAISEVPADD